jgi:NAD-dependent DNA ligase
MLSEVLVMWRDTYEYEIDGVIVNHDKIYPRKSGNPDHAFAFKMILSDQMAEAKVVDVIWSISKDGFLKPKIRIEPIELGGVTIEYATAFNAAFVEEKNLGIGAVVKIIRSGDVIPYIMDVTQPAPEPKMPNEEYKWNKTHVDIILKNVSANKTVQMKNVAYFFKDIGVAGLSSGNIKRIMEAGFETVPQILAMSIDDFLTVEGFKDKLANKIHKNIKETIESTSLPNLMNASNIFGRGLGEKKIIPILEAYPDILTSKKDNDEKLEMVAGIKGMGKITAKGFVCNINKFIEFMREANLEYKLNEVDEPVEYDESHPLYKKKIVITGFRDSDLEKAIKSVGGEMGSSVSKNTFKVIVKNMDEDSGKADQGRKYGILITKDKFISEYLS